MEALLSPKNLSEVLGVAEQTIYNRHSTGGDLPRCIKLGRLLRFRPSDVEAWLAKQEQANLPPPPPVLPTTRRKGRPTKEEQIRARQAH